MIIRAWRKPRNKIPKSNGNISTNGLSKRDKELVKADLRKYGKFGAASNCRRIDPETGEIIEVIYVEKNGRQKPFKKD